MYILIIEAETLSLKRTWGRVPRCPAGGPPWHHTWAAVSPGPDSRARRRDAAPSSRTRRWRRCRRLAPATAERLRCSAARRHNAGAWDPGWPARSAWHRRRGGCGSRRVAAAVLSSRPAPAVTGWRCTRSASTWRNAQRYIEIYREVKRERETEKRRKIT